MQVEFQPHSDLIHTCIALDITMHVFYSLKSRFEFYEKVEVVSKVIIDPLVWLLTV